MFFLNLPLLVFSSYTFLGLFIGVALIGDENHQKLAVGYCADIFTI
jgi:hypothetical protein